MKFIILAGALSLFPILAVLLADIRRTIWGRPRGVSCAIHPPASDVDKIIEGEQ